MNRDNLLRPGVDRAPPKHTSAVRVSHKTMLEIARALELAKDANGNYVLNRAIRVFPNGLDEGFGFVVDGTLVFAETGNVVFFPPERDAR